jgi:hypothetical protein
LFAGYWSHVSFALSVDLPPALREGKKEFIALVISVSEVDLELFLCFGSGSGKRGVKNYTNPVISSGRLLLFFYSWIRRLKHVFSKFLLLRDSISWVQSQFKHDR